MKGYPRRRVVSQYKGEASYWTLKLSCGHEKLNYNTPTTTLCSKCPKEGWVPARTRPAESMDTMCKRGKGRPFAARYSKLTNEWHIGGESIDFGRDGDFWKMRSSMNKRHSNADQT